MQHLRLLGLVQNSNESNVWIQQMPLTFKFVILVPPAREPKYRALDRLRTRFQPRLQFSFCFGAFSNILSDFKHKCLGTSFEEPVFRYNLTSKTLPAYSAHLRYRLGLPACYWSEEKTISKTSGKLNDEGQKLHRSYGGNGRGQMIPLVDRQTSSLLPICIAY